MEINKIYDTFCIDLDFEGNGVCKIEDIPFFVSGPLIGENVKIKVEKISKSFGFAKLTEIVQPSPFRVVPECKLFEKCGGCNVMHLQYQTQLEYKKHIVKDTLKRVGGCDVEVDDCIGMDIPYNYRNNVQIPFGFNGKIIAGFYEKNSHSIVDSSKCLIANKLNEKIIDYIKQLFIRYRITIYNSQNKKGSIRHVVLKNNSKQDFMVIFVTATPYFNNQELIIQDLTNRFKNIISIIHNINYSDSSVVLGNKSEVIFGQPYIIDNLNGLSFEIGANSFYQVNSIQTKKLYNKVLEYADIKPTDNVIDAYCGIGTISLMLAKKAKKVFGIEIVEEAINNAKANMKRNNISNIEFFCGQSELLISQITRNHKIDCLVMDPPRKGCEGLFLSTIVEEKIARLVYVSCNVRTLSRDLKYLVENGYEIKDVTPVDMFPQTSHVESVCLLELKK